MKILIVGSGGREFAVAKKLKESPHVKTVYCAPGNVGMQTIGVETVPIEETDLDGLLDFAKSKHVDWTFVGPENVLCAGITDKFEKAGLTPAYAHGIPYVDEANLVLLCQKMAAVPITEDTFASSEIKEKWYADGDLHTMYVGEIIEVLSR